RSSCSVAVATDVLPLVPVTAVTRGRPAGDVTGWCIEDPLERRRRASSARRPHPITGSRSAGRTAPTLADDVVEARSPGGGGTGVPREVEIRQRLDLAPFQLCGHEAAPDVARRSRSWVRCDTFSIDDRKS